MLSHVRHALAAGLIGLALGSCGGDEPEKRERRLFGFNSALSLWAVQPATEVRYERLAGATAQRYTVSWRSLQPRRTDPPLSPGPSRDRLDGLYRELVKNGMTPIVIPANAPPWAASRRGDDWLPPDRRHVPDWERFVRAVAGRYPRAVIEPWNEPNFHAFWRGGPSDPKLMAELQCAAYRAIPRKRTVLSTGFAVRGGFGEYVDTFIRHGGGRCYDAVSVHLYGDGRMLDSRVRAIERFRRDEVWVTETGASSVPGKVSELHQAVLNRRMYDRFRAMPNVRAILFNTLRDAQDPPLLSKPDSPTYHFGFLRVNFSPKPTFCDFARRARQRRPGCAPGL